MTEGFSLEFFVQPDNEGYLCDLLHKKTNLSKSKIKTALQYGACRLQRKGKKTKTRIRKAKAIVKNGDLILFHFDSDILSIHIPPPKLIHDSFHYSIWDKPAGTLSQGTQFADHCSMMRQVELFYKKKRKVFLVHRLDREASGLFLIAHDKKTAAKFSQLFQNRSVKKTYLVEVLGNVQNTSKDSKGKIINKVDGKSAETNYTVMSYSPETNTSRVSVQIKSGRLHQIRRHFDSLGHPVIGDSRYGKGNKNKDGLKLRAISLSFACPISHKEIEYKLEGF